MPRETHTPPRQIRIGPEWLEFEQAAKSMSTERAALVRAFIAWYLHKPGAKLPKRPPAWPPGDDTAGAAPDERPTPAA